VRRILLILLVALLPLQWSGAAASVRCLHAGAGHGHATSAAAGHDRAGHVQAAHHGHGSHGHASHAHDHATHDHASHADPHGADPATSAAGSLADLGDCGRADCGGCCHGTGTLPAAMPRVPAAPAFGASPQARVDASPASPSLDGPVRPPRGRSA
jgi:hypothetical protein